MDFKEVKFTDIPIKQLSNAFRQMLEIASQDDYLDAGNEDELSQLISEGYNPDKDFIFMLYNDGKLRVRSQSAQ